MKKLLVFCLLISFSNFYAQASDFEQEEPQEESEAPEPVESISVEDFEQMQQDSENQNSELEPFSDL